MTATDLSGNGSTRVSIDDIRAKLRELSHDVETGVEGAKQGGIAVAVVGVAAVVVVAFWLGRRSGRKRRTIVEIRRV